VEPYFHSPIRLHGLVLKKEQRKVYLYLTSRESLQPLLKLRKAKILCDLELFYLALITHSISE
jgi:hypothetical protein